MVRYLVIPLMAPSLILALAACDGDQDAEPDLSTTEAACAAVDDALSMIESADADERQQGVVLAEMLWLETTDEVADGMRRTCGQSVLDMIDAADLRP